MPTIKQLKTTSLSRIPASDSVPELDTEKQGAFYSLMESFLILNPSPTDEQVHNLTTSVGMDPETFEHLTYKFFGGVLHPTQEPEEDSEFLSDGEDLQCEDDPDSELLSDDEYEDDEDGLMSRITSGKEKNLINHQLFDTSDIVEASDADGRAADNDGEPDAEVLGEEDPLKEASEADGAVDEEVLQEALD